MVDLILRILAFLALAVVGALGSIVITLTVLLQTVRFLAITGPLTTFYFYIGPQSIFILTVVLATHAFAHFIASSSYINLRSTLGEAFTIIFRALGF